MYISPLWEPGAVCMDCVTFRGIVPDRPNTLGSGAADEGPAVFVMFSDLGKYLP